MNAEIFAEWLRRQGMQVYQTPSTWWYEANHRAYQAFPYHVVIDPCEAEISDFMRQSRALALRFSAPLESAAGMVSYHIVYAENTYTLDGLDRRTRQNVRKGLKNCRVEPISLERLAEEGWELEQDTVQRQGRSVLVEGEKWRRRCHSAAGLPGFEAWGALAGDRLVASLLTCQIGDCCEMLSQQCHRDFLDARANNALIYMVTEIMVKRPEIREIFYTMQSLDAPPSVDEFKLRMGYRTRAVRQRVVFGRPLVPAVIPAANALVRGAARLWPQNSDLRKLQGMLHFYDQGRLPCSEQEWPEFLKKVNPAGPGSPLFESELVDEKTGAS